MKSRQELKLLKNSLPKGWTQAHISEICELIGGGTPSRKKREYFGGDIVWLTPTEIKKTKINVVADSKEKITQSGLKHSSAKIIPKGAVLLTSRASIGYIAIAGIPLTTNQGFMSFVCNNQINNYFLAYWLALHRDLFRLEATGTTFKEITKSRMRTFFISFPLVSEQKRIVSKIESTFSQIDVLEEALKVVLSQLTKFRQVVLKLAFEGRLVSQNTADEPAVVFLNNVCEVEKKRSFGPNNLPNGWSTCLLPEIAQLNPNKPSNNLDPNNLEVSFIPMKNVEEITGNINLSETGNYRKIRKAHSCFQDNDIIFAKITPCMENGKIAIATGLKNEIGIGSTEFHVIRLHPSLSPKFYFFYFIQNSFRNHAQQRMTGTAGQVRLPLSYLKNILIPFPPLNEQKRIVSKIEKVFARIDTIETNIAKLLSTLPMLKQSILKLAFEGKLVPQDPRDEHARILLERIKDV